jgi:hypothetical protein
MSRDEELTRGAIIFEITPEQMTETLKFLKELLEKTRELQNYFLQSKIDCLPDPMHIIHLNIQSIINITKGLLIALMNTDTVTIMPADKPSRPN